MDRWLVKLTPSTLTEVTLRISGNVGKGKGKGKCIYIAHFL